MTIGIPRGSSRPADLLPLGEVARRLHIVGQSYVGVEPIAVERIVGSVDRSVDFDRRFRPRRRGLTRRLERLGERFSEASQRAFPAISVYEVGGAYFVIDGHHRVGLARERGMAFLDAEITRLRTSYEIGPDVDVRQLIHTEQRDRFMEESGLERARPDAVIEFSRPTGYAELLELVKAHSFDVARREGRLVSAEEAAGDWYDNVYQPVIEAARRVDLQGRHSHKTDTDIFLWVYGKLRAMRITDPDATYDDAAECARTKTFSAADRRAFMREKVPPLPRRRRAPTDGPRVD
jgi:hypothetical protein